MWPARSLRRFWFERRQSHALLFLAWQPHDDFQARRLPVSARHGTVTGFDARLHDGEPESHAARFARPRGIDSIERIEKFWQFALGHARSTVGHNQFNFVVPCL